MKTEPLKLAVIYDPKCPKMTELAYSRTYLDMFEAVVERFETVQRITESCSAQDIDADVILIYDIHSAHHIVIDGLEDHTAVKYTYFNDPYQKAVEGVYRENNVYVCKLGARSRTIRALARGVDFIICPYKNLYFKHIAKHLGTRAEDMLFWFPPAPSIKRFPEALRTRPLAERKHKILANGLTHGGDGSYDFRKWAFAQKNSFYVEHAAYKPSVPNGASYVKLLAQFTGALALCDTRIVPKYLEIPLAGCVCFAQEQQDYRDMGFQHGIHCVYVSDIEDFEIHTEIFRDCRDIETSFQAIADAGRKLIEDNWTAEHFADALYNHALKRVQPNSKGLQL